LEVVASTGKVLLERAGVAVEADEDEAAELLHALDRRDVELAVLGGVGWQGLAARHADEAPAVVERPGVVTAGEGAAIARLLATPHGATVRARVVDRVQLAIASAREQQRPPADAARHEIARLPHLGGVAEIEPAFAEHPLALGRQDL